MGKLISFLHFLYFTLLWVCPFFSILICYVYFFLCEWIKLRNINLRFIAWLWLVQLHCCWEYHILSLYLWNEMGCFMFSISNSWSQCYKCCKPRCFCIVLKNDKILRIFDRLKKIEFARTLYMLTMEMQLFSDWKYIFSSSSRQYELRPSEYEQKDTIRNESKLILI